MGIHKKKTTVKECTRIYIHQSIHIYQDRQVSVESTKFEKKSIKANSVLLQATIVCTTLHYIMQRPVFIFCCLLKHYVTMVIQVNGAKCSYSII